MTKISTFGSRTSAVLMALALAMVMATGCKKKAEHNEGPLESAGEEVDEAGEKAGDKIEEAGDNVEDATD